MQLLLEISCIRSILKENNKKTYTVLSYLKSLATMLLLYFTFDKASFEKKPAFLLSDKL